MASGKKGKAAEGSGKAKKGRQEDAPKGAGSGAAETGRFVWIAKIWIGLTGASLGASSYFLASGKEFFSKEISQIGSLTVNPGLLMAVAVAVLFTLGIMRLFRGRLGWALPLQGRGVRMTGYLGVMVLMVFGAYQLHGYPGTESSWYRELASIGPLLGKTFDLRPIFFPSSAVALLSGLVCHFFFGKARWRAFMIETEAEMKKVSWPARVEWVGSSIVVLVVVTTMALFLYACDRGLSWVMEKVNVGF